MNMYIEKLRDKVRTLQRKLTDAEAELKLEVSQCKHSWTDPVVAYIRHEEYTIPGDRELWVLIGEDQRMLNRKQRNGGNVPVEFVAKLNIQLKLLHK